MPYKTRDQMMVAWDALRASYPTLCSSEILGYSVQNRPIKLYKIGNPKGGRLAIVSNIHGEEKAAVEIVLMFAQWVLSSQDLDAVRIRERNLLLIIPLVCIDSYDIKSPNANGVNLYFNFDFDFGTGGSGTPGHWQYRGPYALSEPESRIVKKFFTDWMPHIEIATHDGGSGNYIWYVGGIDSVDRTIIQTIYQKYLAKADGVPGVPFNLAINAYGGGRPEPCAYFHNNKMIQALVVENCTHDPPFDTIPATEFPKSKALFVTLAQEYEIIPPPPSGWTPGMIITSILARLRLRYGNS